MVRTVTSGGPCTSGVTLRRPMERAAPSTRTSRSSGRSLLMMDTGPCTCTSTVAGSTRATNPAGAFWIWTFTPRTVVAALAGAIWTATRTHDILGGTGDHHGLGAHGLNLDQLLRQARDCDGGRRNAYTQDAITVGRLAAQVWNYGHGLKRGPGESRVLGGDHIVPGRHGNEEREQQQKVLLVEQPARPHARRNVRHHHDAGAGVSAANSSRRAAFNSSSDMPRMSSPSRASVTVPVSSDTIIATASVCSAIPSPARCRVPSVRATTGFSDRGSRQPAATTRFPRIMAAPSCSGELGKNRLIS